MDYCVRFLDILNTIKFTYCNTHQLVPVSCVKGPFDVENLMGTLALETCRPLYIYAWYQTYVLFFIISVIFLYFRDYFPR